MKGSDPEATASGSGASGSSNDQSSWHAKKRRNGRRRFVECSRIVPLSIGKRVSIASITLRCVTRPTTSTVISVSTWASLRRWKGSSTRTISKRLYFNRDHRRQVVHDRLPGISGIRGHVHLTAGRAEVDAARIE